MDEYVIRVYSARGKFDGDIPPDVCGEDRVRLWIDPLPSAARYVLELETGGVWHDNLTLSEQGICDGMFFSGVDHADWTRATAEGRCGGNFTYAGPFDAGARATFSFLGSCHSRDFPAYIQHTTTVEMGGDCGTRNFSVLCASVYARSDAPTLRPTARPTVPRTAAPTMAPVSSTPTSAAPTAVQTFLLVPQHVVVAAEQHVIPMDFRVAYTQTPARWIGILLLCLFPVLFCVVWVVNRRCHIPKNKRFV